MTPTPTSKEIFEGIRSLGNLLKMLREAAIACKVRAKAAGNRSENVGLTLDGAKYKVAISYADPETLWFATRSRIDCEAATRLGVGEVEESSWVPGRYMWRRRVKLNSQEVDFFSRTAGGQMQWLEGFLRDCLTKARSIEIPEQPPIPEEPEEE